MNIPTPKYEIDHIFWVPRCRKVSSVEHKVIDGEKYQRHVDNYIPFVKQKIVRSIYIIVDYRKRTTVEYNCIDFENLPERFALNTDFNLPQRYLETNIENYSKEEAEKIAAKYAADKFEFFGKKDEDWVNREDLYEE